MKNILSRTIVVAMAGLLAGCTAFAGAGSDRFPRTGARYESQATRAQWTKHVLTLWAGGYPGTRTLPEDHVLDKQTAATQFNAAENARLSLTWFGHSSFLIRAGGTSILTDPVFSATAGFGLFSVHRIAPVRPDPGIIRDVDAILITHADYDHLDIGTLRRLARRFPGAVVFVPQATAKIIRPLGFARVVEMDWYDRDRAADARIVAVPAIHSTRRVPHHSVDSMHWNGYRIDMGGRAIYFAGDTGAGDLFAEIPRRTGRSDIAIVPAGAWAPRGFERPFHVEPEEALDIARTVGAHVAIGMHWGTFALSEETVAEQRERFLSAGTRGVKPVLMRIGETRVLRR
ncbi:MAG: MBL fold metallo-hydrolase [Tepidamorphaceae bacterium]